MSVYNRRHRPRVNRQRRFVGTAIAVAAATSFAARQKPYRPIRPRVKLSPRIHAVAKQHRSLAIGSRPSGASLHYVPKVGRGKVRRPVPRRAQTTLMHNRSAMGIGSGRRSMLTPAFIMRNPTVRR